MAAIVWNPEPTEYGDFNGRIDAINSDVTVECSNGLWTFHVWGPTDVPVFHSPRRYGSAERARQAAEWWAA